MRPATRAGILRVLHTNIPGQECLSSGRGRLALAGHPIIN